MELSLQRENLINDNYYLIHYVIKNFIDTSSVKNNPLMDYEDLVQYGAVGLCKAASAYDEKKGAFSTLACKSIKNSLINALTSKSNSSRECSLDDEMINLAATLDEPDADFLLSNIFSAMEKGREKDLELKRAITILLYEGYSLRAAARKLGISHQKARVCLNHIRQYAGSVLS